MSLPLHPPVLPQLAKSGKAMPTGDGWVYEPKWDGFRVIAFVDGDDVYLQSRGSKPLLRYFPELSALPAGRYVLDGEIVVPNAAGEPDFEGLQQRIHPAVSRVERLSIETPAVIYAFDLLAEGDESLLERPFRERRERLAAHLGGPVQATPVTADPDAAGEWLLATEGVIAKELDAPYRPGKRAGMVKVKRLRTIDCVIVGWRPGKAEGTVGSLILGLYTLGGELQVVGHSSGLSASEKKELVDRLAPYETGERGTGDASRWDGDRELEWRSVRPELVVEIAYDTKSPGRIRHGTRILRWREDKAPKDCTIDQLT
jgi:ATP-dependent DNA ligase